MVYNEAETRQNLIDPKLEAAGWTLQDRKNMNLFASRGIAVREFPLDTGFADYLLFVDRQAVGVVEAKAEGTPLSGVANNPARILPAYLIISPIYNSPYLLPTRCNGVEVYFRNERDPAPRSRRVSISINLPPWRIGLTNLLLCVPA